jgi:Cu-Zn family superoxide dismutase
MSCTLHPKHEKHAIAFFDPGLSSNVQKISGYIRFFQKSPSDPVLIEINLIGFPKNESFACHVHQYGDMSDGCMSSCSHFNPYHQLHGNYLLHKNKRHVGDLAIPGGNLKSNRYGHVTISFYDDLISLFPIYANSVIGRMVVIHEHSDDGGYFRNENTKKGKESGITGNAGKRIACSIIGISSQ